MSGARTVTGVWGFGNLEKGRLKIEVYSRPSYEPARSATVPGRSNTVRLTCPEKPDAPHSHHPAAPGDGRTPVHGPDARSWNGGNAPGAGRILCRLTQIPATETAGRSSGQIPKKFTDLPARLRLDQADQHERLATEAKTSHASGKSQINLGELGLFSGYLGAEISKHAISAPLRMKRRPAAMAG